MRRLLPLFGLLLLTCHPQPDPDPPQTPVVEIEAAPPAYDRSTWGRWEDADHDCQDTRQEVLIAESLVLVQLDDKGCKVVSGRWKDVYTGVLYTNPSDLDIDHMVPLKAAHDAGAWQWDEDRKSLYFNDLGFVNHLIAVSASSNRSKGSRGPLEWMPPNKDSHCEYLKSWMLVKANYSLEVTCEEGSAIAMMMAQACTVVEVPPAP